VPRRENADIHGLTHPGLVRKENQDHFLIATIHKILQVYQTSVPEETLGNLTSPSRGFVFLVADGVGGGPGGKEASRTALKGVVDYVVRAMDLASDRPMVELEYRPNCSIRWRRVTNSCGRSARARMTRRLVPPR
jgi:protein phosphatase